MGIVIVLVGLFLFVAAYICVPLFDATKNLHRQLMEANRTIEINAYQQSGDKAYIRFFLSIAGSFCGLVLLLIVFKVLALWGNDVTNDDGALWFTFAKLIVIASVISCFTTPVVFAVNVKATVETWREYRKTHKLSKL